MHYPLTPNVTVLGKVIIKPDKSFSLEALLAGARAYFEQVFSPATAEEKAVVFGLCPPELTRVAPGHGVVVGDYLDDLLAYYESVCQS